MRQVQIASTARTFAVILFGAGLHAAIVAVRRTLIKNLIDDYRPERHYMRGPGPKCREKAGLQASTR